MSILVNPTFKDYSYISRYSKFPYYYNTLDNKYIYGITSYLDDSTLYTLHTVSKGESFDSLALKYYNNPTLYWVICSYNHVQDPYKELTEGESLKIPVLSNIRFNNTTRS